MNTNQIESIETIRKKILFKTIFESIELVDTRRRIRYLRKFQNTRSKDDTCFDITRVYTEFLRHEIKYTNVWCFN